jgi:NAD(P)-dependent dehydrogenase (short-subunit alcohol dehydrogenase family)
VIAATDVTDLSSLKNAVSQVEGEVDLLICNAGVLQNETLDDLKSVNEKALESIEKQFAVNTMGPIKTFSSF